MIILQSRAGRGSRHVVMLLEEGQSEWTQGLGLRSGSGPFSGLPLPIALMRALALPPTAGTLEQGRSEPLVRVQMVTLSVGMAEESVVEKDSDPSNLLSPQNRGPRVRWNRCGSHSSARVGETVTACQAWPHPAFHQFSPPADLWAAINVTLRQGGQAEVPDPLTCG